jgi:N-methylhydantoinase A/oxoprolinase/acetone carboxylase beta subunit
LGIDIGGTFTDFVLLDDSTGQLDVFKCLTTPAEPSQAVLQGAAALLQRKGLGERDLALVFHATTLATNAIIERKGARTGLLTTIGFGDTLEMATERRYDLYDIFIDFPEPLVARELVREVPERLTAEGTVYRPLDETAAREAIRSLRDEGVQAIAVCFIHAYQNPVHERRVRELIQEECPGLHVSISSDVLPELREYYRMSTTAANAYLQPSVETYLGELVDALRRRGFGGRMYLMLSNGGTSSVETAKAYPVRLLESGPAAGVLAATSYGASCGLRNVLSFDMGGTTAKLSVVVDGRPSKAGLIEVARLQRFKPGSGLPIKSPVLELIEIGAGGGSIARIDHIGLLKVGPDSAGADPGPACYGLGGTEPTVTDSDLVLGYLDPGYFLGGDMPLYLERAREAIERAIAQPAGMSLVNAAWGIHHVVNEQMAAAAKIHVIERGRDPRKFSMVAFGGAGPVHAYGVARSLRLERIVFPARAGIASAWGLLVAPMAFDFVQTHKVPLDRCDFGRLNAILEEMEDAGRRILAEAGVSSQAITLTRAADMRYVGQGYEIAVDLPHGTLGPGDLPELRRRFDAAYEALYSHLSIENPVELVNLRLTASSRSGVAGPERLALAPAPAATALKGYRDAYFQEAGGFVRCSVYDRYRLTPGATFAGPAIVEEKECTGVIGPSGTATVDEFGNVIVGLRHGR